MYASRVAALSFLLVLAVFVAVPANAGFIDGSIQVSSPTHSAPTWDWDMEGAHLSIYEDYAAYYDGTYPIMISGATDEDPILTITKTVTNTTGYAWSAYHMDLAAGPNSFVGVSTSDTMTLAFQDALNVDFGPPSFVLDGNTVSFTIQVLVPTVGPFNFTLTQSPELVPEPATLALLGLAACLMSAIRCRRQRS